MKILDTLLRHAANRRFLALFVAPNVAFTALALPTSAPQLIPILNLVVVALAVNVCVAFAPNVFSAVFADRNLDKADLLSIGIFLSWFAIVLRSAWSLAWRYLDQPPWMLNTDFISYFIYLTVAAGIFHLAAPGSLKESVPPLRWVRIGAMAAVAVFLGLVMIYASDLREGWERMRQPNDVAPTPSSLIRPL